MSKGKVRLADIARASGVSQGTASNVFSRPEVVRDEVREHVLAVARDLGYAGPSVTGRLLRAGKVNAIGVAAIEPLAYFFDDPWARAFLAALADVCDAKGTGLTLVSARNQQKLSWNIQSALVDGFILLCVEGGERLVELTRERQLPFISLALGSDDQSIPAIGVNNIDGAATAARHLTRLGHRRFVILATEFTDDHVGRISAPEIERGDVYSTSRDRAVGYWHALAEVGIAREVVPVFETQNDRPSVHACLEQVFSTAERPTAILAMSDNIAMLAMAWLTDHGLNVPVDISIVGFDGVPEGGMVKPGLTTMAQPFQELAVRAVHAILDDAIPTEREIIEVKLIERGSTAAPKT
ncbi:DNA-binding LacI/PurR family transcriptional regulator [Phyllobacterium myrsinacearum]|uniref:DNA-binding LacI/PurR family transcriptional regulator n=1 Tax=Phyllobacterium myrsinacearum TaxID=28101 RepID=A0A839EV09_9HYPH|nr:LacI family DNA-binding transcriptional regulator [Phyllobacterium myrsinacearum]MBA8881334.1 DNA-binding LacI/PurR family transcriptional regulator [Phyllobacterium myrsinacearum]